MSQRKIQNGNKKHLETNENENTTHPNLWNTDEFVLRENFIAINACIKKEKKDLKYTHKLCFKELGGGRTN